MFILRFIRRLLALPLSIAAGISSIFAPAVAAWFYKLAWSVSGDGHPGQLALVKLAQSGRVEEARAAAGAMMHRRPSPEIASFAGLIEIDCSDVEQAARYLSVAREMGGDREGLTELLAYRVEVDNASDSEQAGKLLESLAERRDLSPGVSKLALEGMMWRTLTKGDFAAARGRAEHLLAVSDNPQAQIVLGAIYQMDGRSADAARCRGKTVGLSAAQTAYFRSVAAGATGNKDDLLESLSALRDENPDLARQVESQLARAGETS